MDKSGLDESGLDEAGKPPRVVGLFGATLINLNAVVGSGIFALPALLFAAAGNFAPYAILIFAVFYGSIMAVVAKLSTVFRQSGGAQLYAEHAFGKAVGFQVGWFALAANMTGSAANFHVLVSYLAAIFPFFADPVVRALTILVLILLFMGIAMSGTKRSIGALAAGTFLKLAPVIVLCFVGFAQNGLPGDVSLPQFSEVESIALLLAFAFSGADVAVASAGETKEPRKTIMRAIFLNLTLVALFYAMVQMAYIAIGPDPAEVDSPLSAAADMVFGPSGGLLISLAVIFSVATFQLNVFVAIPRIIYGMARRGLMPEIFTFVSSRFQTPAAAIGGYGIFVGILTLSGGFAFLATLLVAVEQSTFVCTIAALIVMWKRNSGGIADQMDARWLIVIPVAIGMVAWLLAQVPLTAALYTLALVAIGVVLYILAKRSGVAYEDVILPQTRS